MHRQHHLHHSGHSSGRLQMADVGLHRADQQGVVVVVSLSVGRPRRVGFDGVAHLGTGAVRLHVVHVRRSQAGPPDRFDHDPLLRRAARYRQPGAGPVLVYRRAPNNAPDAVAVSLRLAESLQDHDAAALAPHISVRGGVEGRTASVGRQHPGGCAHFQQPAGEDRVYATREREVRLSPLKSRHGLVDGHQRRRAGGVKRDGRALQPQGIRDPSDGGVEGGAGNRIETRRGLGGVAYVEDQPPVLVVADPGVDAGAAALQCLWIDARIFKRPPARLQHHALLRIEQLRLDRRDAEEGGVEVRQIVEVGAEPAGYALHVGVREEFAYSSDSRTRNSFDDRVSSAFQQAPEGFDVVGAGEPARHADDRDRLTGCRKVRPGGGHGWFPPLLLKRMLECRSRDRWQRPESRADALKDRLIAMK